MSKVKFYEKHLGVKPEFYFWSNKMNPKLIMDYRQDEWEEQRKQYGFDEREVWSLKTTLAAFIYPRLKFFAERTRSHPARYADEKWELMLEKMTKAFEYVIKEEVDLNGFYIDDVYDEFKEGMKLFAENFLDLWG